MNYENLILIVGVLALAGFYAYCGQFELGQTVAGGLVGYLAKDFVTTK